MNSRKDFLNNPNIREYFKEEIGSDLILDDDEFDRRLQLYLEIFPFLSIDFRLKGDCNKIHQSAKLLMRGNMKHKHKIIIPELNNLEVETDEVGVNFRNISISQTSDVNNEFTIKRPSYRKLLDELKEKIEQIEISTDEGVEIGEFNV